MLDPIPQSFWSITRETRISAPAVQVWEAIAAPGSLEACHPFVETNPVAQWGGVGSKDMLRYYSGLTFYREFCAWEAGQGYDLMIGVAGRLTTKVQWRVHPVRQAESTLAITVQPMNIIGWKRWIYWLPMLVYLRPLMHTYLDSVVGGYRYFITTGQPVPRNHFGALRVFSPPLD